VSQPTNVSAAPGDLFLSIVHALLSSRTIYAEA